ncbi:hypothetical protein K466DRAFT_571195, partial [Polyporus arcularius HHB13444]
MPPSRSQSTATQLGHPTLSPLKVAARRYRGETKKDRFRRLEQIAKVFADRRPKIAPICPHPMYVRQLSVIVGALTSPQCFRNSCAYKERVQYLSERLTPRQLYELNNHRPADPYVRPSRRVRVWHMVKDMLHAHGYDSDPDDVDAYIHGDMPDITGDEDDAAAEAEDDAETTDDDSDVARSSASEAAREAPHRRSRKADTPAEREARKTYRAAAISAALRKRSQPPVCDHTLARSIQYRKGNDNDGRFVGICGVDGCTRVQYLSAPLTKAELDALHAQRPGARFDSPPAQHSALTDMTNLPIAWHVLAYLT